jgi:hypothetical protein
MLGGTTAASALYAQATGNPDYNDDFEPLVGVRYQYGGGNQWWQPNQLESHGANSRVSEIRGQYDGNYYIQKDSYQPQLGISTGELAIVSQINGVTPRNTNGLTTLDVTPGIGATVHTQYAGSAQTQNIFWVRPEHDSDGWGGNDHNN